MNETMIEVTIIGLRSGSQFVMKGDVDGTLAGGLIHFPDATGKVKLVVPIQALDFVHKIDMREKDFNQLTLGRATAITSDTKH